MADKKIPFKDTLEYLRSERQLLLGSQNSYSTIHHASQDEMEHLRKEFQQLKEKYSR